LAEAWLGAGRQFRNLILLTLGTGVGGAIILDRKLFIGHQGTAGELGLITLNPDGPRQSRPLSSTSQLQQFVAARVWNQLVAKAGDTNALTFGKLMAEI